MIFALYCRCILVAIILFVSHASYYVMYVHSHNDIPLGQICHIDAIFRLKLVAAATMQPYDPYWQWHHWHYGSAWPQWGYGYPHREYRPSPREGSSMVTKLSASEPAEMPEPKKKPSSSSESASSKEKGDRSSSETSPAAKADDGKPDSPAHSKADFSPPPSPADSKPVSRARSREKKPAQKVDKKAKKEEKEKSEKSDKKHKDRKEKKSKHDDKPGTSRSSKAPREKNNLELRNRSRSHTRRRTRPWTQSGCNAPPVGGGCTSVASTSTTRPT